MDRRHFRAPNDHVLTWQDVRRGLEVLLQGWTLSPAPFSHCPAHPPSRSGRFWEIFCAPKMHMAAVGGVPLIPHLFC